MGKIIRRVIAILLTVTAVVLGCLPPVNAEAVTEQSNFMLEGTTITSYTGTDTELTIPNTVTTIGKDAFSGCETLEKLTIPDSVKVIDYAAFEDCINLKKVTIPESVKTIGSSAFSGCVNLDTINIPSKMSSIGSAAFARCTNLNTIQIASGNMNYKIDDGVLYSRDGKTLVQYLAGRTLSTYNMPDSVKKIEEYAFWGADLLTNVAVSKGVKEIPEYAFDNCNGLTTVTLPASVESLMAYSFGDCVNLKSIVIPDSVGYIDENAFACSGNVKIELTDKPVASDENTESSDTSSSLVGDASGVSDNAVDSLSGTANTAELTQVQTSITEETVLPGELASGRILGGTVMMMMPSNVYVKGFAIDDAETEDSLASNGGNTTFSDAEFDTISGVLAHYGGTDSDVNIPNGVNEIGNRLFYKNEGLKSAALPETVNEIGDFAFARSGLESIQIPSSVDYVGYAAFYHCNNLSNVTIPSSVQLIELGAFEGSLWLNNWLTADDSNNYLVVGDGILLAYKGEGGNIAIPEGVKTIGAGCFEGNTSITGIAFPTSLSTIGEDAFNGCSSLATLQLPEGLETIEDRAFKNTGIRSVTIPSTVFSIGLGAFDNTDIEQPVQTVIFTGNDLPNIDSKPTAARLSAQDLRSRAFEGTETAIVNPNCSLDSGNVFDTNTYGFRGQIFTMTTDAASGQTGLELQRVTQEPDEKTGSVIINSKVAVDGNEYFITGVREHAFSPYETSSEWCSNRLTDIKIDGNASQDLTALLSNVSFSSTPGTVADEGSVNEDNAISIQMDVSDMSSANAEKVSARIPGNTETYYLQIKDDESERDRLNQAFYNYYGQVGDITMLPLSISMTDSTGTLPIEKLATGKMEITLPIPTKFIGSENLKMGTLDDNGALEELSTEMITVDGTECLRFVASHLSPYVIYKVRTSESSGNVFSQSLEESLTGHQISGVVMTLNKKVGTIEAKWFVIVILILSAAVLALWKTPRRKNMGIN